MRAAVCWSSQKPGADIWASSSAARAASESGSKVITDPGELGPDLLQLLVERLRLLGHVGGSYRSAPLKNRRALRARHDDFQRFLSYTRGSRVVAAAG